MKLNLEKKIEEIVKKTDIFKELNKNISFEMIENNAICDCPFCKREDRFVINGTDKQFKCYGCGEEGNVVDFRARYEHISKEQACRELCEENNIEYNIELTDKERQMYTIMSKAGLFYYNMLKGNATGMTYLKDRGLTKETIKKFAIGIADNGWTGIRDALRQEGFSDKDMLEIGLISQNSKTGNTYDKFTNRIMFPIIDKERRIVGFSGRLYKPDDKRDSKYFNSPASIIFNKSETLFGINYAVQSSFKSWILCEGQLDVITSHQAGYNTTVASLGTSFTKEHADTIREYTKKVYLAFDNDEAGIKAKLRAIPILRNAGLEVKVIDLAPYKDPDELLNAEDNKFYNERILNAMDSYEYEVKMWLDNPELYKDKYEQAIIQGTNDEVERYRTAYEKYTEINNELSTEEVEESCNDEIHLE